MDVLILAFHDDDDNCTQYEAEVDTLDPICAVLDNDDEPDAPTFPGCALYDSSYGAFGGKNEFVFDYGVDDASSLDPVKMEQVLRDFAKTTYGISILNFAKLPEDSDEPDVTRSAPKI